MTTEGEEPDNKPEDDGAARRSGTPRWMSLLLIGSLAVNLLVVGVVSGTAIRSMASDDDGLNRRERRMQRLLPESHHEAWKYTVHAGESEKAAIWESITVVHSRMVTILRKDPFEPEAFGRAFQERVTLQGKMLGLTGRQLLSMASTMNAAERAVMADRMEEAVARRSARRAERAQKAQKQ
ncbi:MAG: periplasmic heavy metal sensor [Pseudomonadota bacterium]